MSHIETSIRVAEPAEDGVGVIEIASGAEGFITSFTLQEIHGALHAFDDDPACRAVVVRSEGKHFCTGRNWREARHPDDTAEAIYVAARELVRTSKPWVAELTGGSIGVGMGLAMCADFRVAAHDAYLWSKFVQLGIHHGFGLSATLPRTVGHQRAYELLATGRRVTADESLRIGMVDVVVRREQVSAATHDFATELASLPPSALVAIKSTLRQDFQDEFDQALQREYAAQRSLHDSEDFQRMTGGGYRYTPLASGRAKDSGGTGS